jgi:hypothetical protein
MLTATKIERDGDRDGRVFGTCDDGHEVCVDLRPARGGNGYRVYNVFGLPGGPFWVRHSTDGAWEVSEHGPERDERIALAAVAAFEVS